MNEINYCLISKAIKCVIKLVEGIQTLVTTHYGQDPLLGFLPFKMATAFGVIVAMYSIEQHTFCNY